MTKTATSPRITCRRCFAVLSRGNTKGIGPTCARRERQEQAETARIAAIDTASHLADMTGWKDPAAGRAKAAQLLIDHALTPTRIAGQYLAKSSDGTDTYLVDLVEDSCTCRGRQRHGHCCHLVAAYIVAILDSAYALAA